MYLLKMVAVIGVVGAYITQAFVSYKYTVFREWKCPSGSASSCYVFFYVWFIVGAISYISNMCNVHKKIKLIKEVQKIIFLFI